MEVLRQVGQFQLVFDPLQKMYRIVNTILLEYTKNEGVSYWFGEETKEIYMIAGQHDFIQRAKQSAGNNIYSPEVRNNFWEVVEPKLVKGKLSQDIPTPFGDTFKKGWTAEEIGEWFDRHFGVMQPDGSLIPKHLKSLICF